MEFDSEKDATTSPNNNLPVPEATTTNASKFIRAITDFFPAFFSPNDVLLKESKNEGKPNTLEAIIQSEEFFSSHPNFYQDDEAKNAFVINKLNGTARK